MWSGVCKGLLGNLGLPLSHSHPPTRRPDPKYGRVWHTEPLPPMTGVKNSITMCLAYMALQHLFPRPVVNCCKLSPQLAIYYLGECLSSDKPRCKHVLPHKHEGEFLHYNDAIEDRIVTFFFRHIWGKYELQGNNSFFSCLVR